MAGDANLKAENIRGGVSIFGVSGSLTMIDPSKWSGSVETIRNGVLRISDGKGCKAFGCINSVECIDQTGSTIFCPIFGFLADDGKYYGTYIPSSSADLGMEFGELITSVNGTSLQVGIDPGLNATFVEDVVQVYVFG